MQLKLYGVSDQLRNEFAVFETQAWIDRGFEIVLEPSRSPARRHLANFLANIGEDEEEEDCCDDIGANRSQ